MQIDRSRLAPALLVYALGAERLGKAGLLLSIVFVAGSVYKTAEFLNEPRQDWVAGAEAVERELSVDQGGCIVFVPEGAWAFFGFSHPDLPDRACPDPNAAKHLILAVSPYPDEAPYQAAAAALRQSGKQQISTESFEGPRVEVWE